MNTELIPSSRAYKLIWLWKRRGWLRMDDGAVTELGTRHGLKQLSDGSYDAPEALLAPKIKGLAHQPSKKEKL